MLRRKMFIYALMFSLGILSAYYILEKTEMFWGSLFFISIALLIVVVPQKTNEVITDKDSKICLAILLLGFIFFLLTFIQMNRSVINEEGQELGYGETVAIYGEVIDVMKKDEYYRLTIRPNRDYKISKLQVSYYKELPLKYEGNEDMYSIIGAKLCVYGELRKPEPSVNPGCFNYRLYMYSKRIRFTMNAKLIRIDGFKENMLIKYRKKMFRNRDRFLDSFSGKERAFIKGVVFGDKSELDEDTLDAFNINSTGHILAVSGLHIGFLYLMLRILTGRRKSKKISILIIATFIIYGEMTRWSPSTIRACVVLSISILSTFAKRPFDLLSSISTAAIVILVTNPYQLFNTGFQMSFLALLGICFLADPISHFIGEGIAGIISIQLTIIPILIYTYNGFNLMSLFINIPIVFLASILVPAALISLFVMSVTGIIPACFIVICETLSDLIISINKFCTLKGFFYNSISGSSLLLLVSYYLVIFIFSSEWSRIKLIRHEEHLIKSLLPLVMGPLVCFGILSWNSFSDDELIFLSVGQGDSVHIRVEDKDVLIDGGGNTNYNIGKNTLKPYLLKSGADNLDIALVTHLHSDHYLGIEELEDCFYIAKVGVPSSCISEETASIPEDKLMLLSTGDRISLNDEIYIEPIWPVRESMEAVSLDDNNENNMVYIIYYGSFKIMITGDLLEEDENKLIQYYKGSDVLKCDVLKIAHHGSKTSSGEAFLDEVSPAIAVISVGANNMYGHPNQEILDRLDERGIKVYRTDEDGAIGLDIRNKSIHIDTMIK